MLSMPYPIVLAIDAQVLSDFPGFDQSVGFSYNLVSIADLGDPVLKELMPFDHSAESAEDLFRAFDIWSITIPELSHHIFIWHPKHSHRKYSSQIAKTEKIILLSSGSEQAGVKATPAEEAAKLRVLQYWIGRGARQLQ